MKLTKLAAFFCISLSAAMLTPAHADALADVMKSGTLRVAVPQDFPPYGSVTADMQIQGLDIDVAKMVAKSLGVKVVLVPVASANRIPYLQSNRVDLVISTLGRNAEREKVMDFSQPYAPYNNSLFGAADIKVSGPADLANQTVGVARGTFEDILLTKSVPASTIIKRYEDNNTLISAYTSGQVKLMGTGDFVAVTLGEQNPARKPVFKYIIQESRCVVGVNKGETALNAKVNAVLTQAKKSGELSTLVTKWLHVPLPEKLATTFE